MLTFISSTNLTNLHVEQITIHLRLVVLLPCISSYLQELTFLNSQWTPEYPPHSRQETPGPCSPYRSVHADLTALRQ